MSFHWFLSNYLKGLPSPVPAHTLPGADATMSSAVIDGLIQLQALGSRLDACQILTKQLGTGNLAEALTGMGRAFFELGQYTMSLQSGQDAVRQATEWTADMATALDSTGRTLWKLGRSAEALDFEQKALKMRGRASVCGKMHWDTAASLDNVGRTLGAMGKHDKALEHQLEALDICEHLLAHSLATAETRTNYANTLGALGFHSKALAHQQQALNTRKALLKPPNSFIAESLNNTGNAFLRLGSLKKALELQEAALKMYMDVHMGNFHPDTATSMYNVSCTLLARGCYKRALKLAREALAIRQDVLGDKHPHTVKSRSQVDGITRAVRKSSWRCQLILVLAICIALTWFSIH